MNTDIGWYPVALADQLEPGTSAGTRLFGREIVVWRDTAGVSHVWEDRCPHRGMRLSFGFVRGSHIACLYHGWQFDAAGRCRFIPAHPQLEVPPTITVSRFASAERLGLLWVYSGDQAAADAPPGGNAATDSVRSIAIGASRDSVRASLDVAASPFGGGTVTVEEDGPLVTMRAGDACLYAALQPVSSGETMIHLAVAATGPSADRKSLSLWAEALRRAVEALS